MVQSCHMRKTMTESQAIELLAKQCEARANTYERLARNLPAIGTTAEILRAVENLAESASAERANAALIRSHEGTVFIHTRHPGLADVDIVPDTH